MYHKTNISSSVPTTPQPTKGDVVSTLFKRAASHCSMNSLVREERSYMKETLYLSPQCSPSRKNREKNDPRSRVTIPYIQGISEAVTRDINVQVHMKPFKTLRRILPHPKDCILMMKPSVVHKINFKTVMPATCYIGETRRALKICMLGQWRRWTSPLLL